MKGKKVLVLGAGIGGLSAASQLAFQGFEVTVLEKNATAGGKIIQFEKNGFTFDGGPSFITITEVYRDWFTKQGRDITDYITFTKMEETTTFHFSNGKQLTLYPDEAKVRAQIARDFPGDEIGFDRFMKISGKVYDLLYHGPKLARRNYHKLWGFDYVLDPRVVLNSLQLNIHQSWKSLVEQHFSHPELQAIFSYQATFLGMSPAEAMGTYCFFPWSEINDGMYSVKGGIYGIVKGFRTLAEEQGVKFIFNSEVTKLNYQGSQLTSVDTTSGTYEADIFVSNIDGAYFYSHLMPPEKNRFYTESALKRLKHTNSYFTINLGLKKPVEHVRHHTFFIGKNWEEFTKLILEPNALNKFNEDTTSYYFLQPSMLEPWMAPKGKATAFILIPVCGYDPETNWEEAEESFKNRIYDIMEQRDGIPIRSLIEEEIVYSPARWGKEFNLWNNVILSFSLNFMQVNGFRMPNKSREFTNLYHTGSATIPGPGIPPCITSGELVTERILEDYPAL